MILTFGNAGEARRAYKYDYAMFKNVMFKNALKRFKMLNA